MSHFPVLVVTKANDAEMLESALQPFHEYECTGIEDQYVVDIDKTEEVMEHWNRVSEKEIADGETLESWADGYYGYKMTSEGKFFRRTNPNAKWDWWVVGGRWKGRFIVDGQHVDLCQRSELDLEAMRQKNIQTRLKYVTEVYEKISKNTKLSYEQITARWDKFRLLFIGLVATWESVGKPGRLWDWMPQQSEDFVTLYALGISEIGKWGFDSANVPETEADPFEWCNKAPALSSFALVDSQGKWHEKGEMGWFASVSNEKKDQIWEDEFKAMFDAIGPTDWIVVVDCHI